MRWRALCSSPYGAGELAALLSVEVGTAGGLLRTRTSTPPTLNRQRLLLHAGTVCMSIHPEGKSCSDIGSSDCSQCPSCTVRQLVSANVSRDRGFRAAAECIGYGLPETACQVITRHVTRETRVQMRVDDVVSTGALCVMCSPRVQNALDDVASIICQALAAGRCWCCG